MKQWDAPGLYDDKDSNRWGWPHLDSGRPRPGAPIPRATLAEAVEISGQKPETVKALVKAGRVEMDIAGNITPAGQIFLIGYVPASDGGKH